MQASTCPAKTITMQYSTARWPSVRRMAYNRGYFAVADIKYQIPAQRILRSSQIVEGVTQEPRADAPQPVVQIDNHTDPFATIVSIEFGDVLGDLLDTVTALKNLELNIKSAKLSNVERPDNTHKFFVTEKSTSEKVIKSERLEEIRLTILNNILYYHPEESSDKIAWGDKVKKPTGRDPTNPLGPRSTSVNTTIDVREDPTGSHTEVDIQTGDRPGLLTDIVQVLKNLNCNVVSAEVDTLGSKAHDQFYITYHGEALSRPMETLVTNALQYYLSLAELEADESY